MACTAHWASRERPPRLAGQGLAGTWVMLGATLLMAVGASGAVTALGDTLFTASSLVAGMKDDFSPTAHFLQQLRVVHPIVAVFVAVFVLYARGAIAAGRGADAARFSKFLGALVLVQLGLGVGNFLMRAPIALQILHLLMADLVWVVFVLLGAAALGEGVQSVPDACAEEPANPRLA
jgi:heme A synthase